VPPTVETYKLQVWPRFWPDRYRHAVSPRDAIASDHVPILHEHKFFRATSQAYVTRYTNLTKFKTDYYRRRGWLSDIEEKRFGAFYPEEIEALANYLPLIGLEGTRIVITRLERMKDMERWMTMSEAVAEMKGLGNRISHIRDIPQTLSNWVSNDILKTYQPAGIFLTTATWLSATLRYMEIIDQYEEIL